MSFLRRNPRVKGLIAYFGLAAWWLSSFSEPERQYIEATYKPLASEEGSLTRIDVTSSATVCMFLVGLSTWFRKTPEDREIARRVVEKSESLVDLKRDVLGAHFTYQAAIEIWYRERELLPEALDRAIEACNKQIAIAQQAANEMQRQYLNSPLPSHVGYKQLTIIYDKLGRYEDAIRVAEQAKAQGWNGDWDGAIEKCRKKLEKRRN